MKRTPFRPLPFLALGLTVALATFPRIAHAVDSGADAEVAVDAAGSDAASSNAGDAAPTTNLHCTATGFLCTKNADCCAGLYCGAFNASNPASVCGSATPNVIPTSSCSVGGSAGLDGAGFFALVGLAWRIGAGRKRRSRPSVRS